MRTYKIRPHKLWSTDFHKALGISLLANWFPRRWEKHLSYVFQATFLEVFPDVTKDRSNKDALVDQCMY